MQTIIIKLDSQKLDNPDLDMRYTIPDYIENYTNKQITDNGYDYVNESGTELAIWLAAEDAAAIPAIFSGSPHNPRNMHKAHSARNPHQIL